MLRIPYQHGEPFAIGAGEKLSGMQADITIEQGQGPHGALIVAA